MDPHDYVLAALDDSPTNGWDALITIALIVMVGAVFLALIHHSNKER